jgi:hypothetical protein
MRNDLPKRSEQEAGSVLISLLLVMCLTALTFSSSIVSSIEYALANTQMRQAQALALAESGIEHSMMVITAEGDLAALLAGADAVPGTADDGQLLGASPVSVGTFGGSYRAVLTDNDDGDNDPAADVDGTYLLLSTGTVDGVTETVRLVLAGATGGGYTPSHGIMTADDLTFDSGVELLGAASSAFSNGAVTVDNKRLDGGAWAAERLEIYSRDPVVEGKKLEGEARDKYEKSHGNQPAIEIPPVSPADHSAYATFTLGADGKIYRQDGSVEFDAGGGSQWGSWKFEGSGNWMLDGPTNGDEGAYYVEGNVKVAGSGGTSADPIELSLFTEGSVELAGDFHLRAAVNETLAVTGGDVFVTGESSFRGSLLVHEQIKMQGKSTLYGYLIVEDGRDDHELLRRTPEGTHLTDNTTIWPDGSVALGPGGGAGGLRVLEWREEQ